MRPWPNTALEPTAFRRWLSFDALGDCARTSRKSASMNSVIRLLLVLSLRFTGIASGAGDSKATDNQNFLSHVLSKCSEKERPFFEQLKKETGAHEQLLADLKVILSLSAIRAAGDIIRESTLTPEHADYYRKKLGWEDSFGAGNHLRRLLIFASTASFTLPVGQQPITVVLTNDRYQVISWRSAGRGAGFQGAAIQPEGDGGRLTLSFLQLRPSRKLQIDFEVSPFGIYHDYPTADPVRTGLQNWVEPNGPRVTKADCEALAKKIARGMSRAEVEEILKPYRPILLAGGGQGGPRLTQYLFNVDRQIAIWFTLTRYDTDPPRDSSSRQPNDIVAVEPITISRPFTFTGTDGDLERWRAISK